jgi:glutathione S-transferase
MLERKGIEHEVADLQPGFHPLALRLAGFPGGTVPALRIDGRRIQGSREISRALEELQTEPRLFPADPAARAAVQEAERWGEQQLQPVPRRIFRWNVSRNPDMRRWLVRISGMPLPNLVAAVNGPMASAFARKVGATDERVRRDIESLPELLDRVDKLIAEGTIGGAEPNAADFQIGTTVRVFLAFEDLRSLAEGRPAAELAMRIQPRYATTVPRSLPPDWVAAAHARETAARQT